MIFSVILVMKAMMTSNEENVQRLGRSQQGRQREAGVRQQGNLIIGVLVSSLLLSLLALLLGIIIVLEW